VIVAYVPDLMDRSKIAAAAPGTTFVPSPAALASTDAPTVVVDLSRPGVLDALATLRGRRVIGFVSHVDTAASDAAAQAGCEVFRRSEFFRRLPELIS
jgi:hypothetical protein